MKSIQLYHNRINWHIPLLMGCLGFAFFMLMMYTPLSMDDYEDVFVLDTNRYITSSVGSFFSNLYLHYIHFSSRLIPHFFIQFFGVLLGKFVFNIVNTLVFVIFLWQLSDFNSSKSGFSRSLNVVIVLTILVCFLPGFGQVILWQSGACNYLWSAVLILFFNNRLMGENSQNTPSYSLYFLGVLSGWTNEALVLGLAFGYLAYYSIYRNELTQRKKIMLFGFFTGIVFLVLSPCTLNRFFDNRESIVSGSQLLSASLAMMNLRIFPILLILTIWTTFMKRSLYAFTNKDIVWGVAIMASIVFVLFTNHFSSRSRFGIELFSLILLLRLIPSLFYSRWMMAIFLLLNMFIYLPVITYARLNYEEYRNCKLQMEKTTCSIVETNEVKCHPFIERFIIKFRESEESDSYSSKDTFGWIERYFGVHDILFLPHRFVERLRHDRESFKDFEMNNDLPFYAKRIDGNTQFSKAVFHLAETDMAKVPFFLRPIANKMQRYAASEVETNKVDVITLPEGRFLLVYKNSMVDERVTGISVE